MADWSNKKLGKRPAIHDAYAPSISKLLKASIPHKSVDWSAPIKSWGMLANDVCGDCTCAAIYHQIQSWLANTGIEYIPTDAECLALYSILGGYPTQDEGVSPTNVMHYWSQNGVETPFGPDIVAFSPINPKNLNEIKLSVQYFGGVYLGFELPITAQSQNTWDVVSTSGDGAAGSWGGHAVCCISYDEEFFTIVTWGQLLKVSYAFMKTYCDCAYAVASYHWLNHKGITPSNFSWPSLIDQLKSFQ